ncbi:MAG: glycosyltransferase family 1 protein [Melioribacteraceae bacterium]
MIIGLDTSAVGIRSTGTSKYIKCLLDTLRKTNHTIKTFSHGSQNYLVKNKFFNSLPFIKRGGIYRHLYRKYLLASQMNHEKVDCGIFPNYLMPANFSKPAAIVIHDLSFISHPHFYSKAFVLFYKNQLKQTLKKNPVIITISEYSKRCINKYLGVRENEIYLLQAYLTSAQKDNNQLVTNKCKNHPYFLYVGHIEPRKNLSFLIKNFIDWNKENGLNIKLKLAGEVWASSKEIHNLFLNYANHPDIEFLGYVSEEELHELYTGASAFVHASFVEGFGFPVLEAMHYGLPILCSSGSGTEEISGSYSIKFSATDSIDLKKGFDKLLIMLDERKINDTIKFSPELMQNQLNKLLTAIERKIKDK